MSLTLFDQKQPQIKKKKQLSGSSISIVDKYIFFNKSTNLIMR